MTELEKTTLDFDIQRVPVQLTKVTGNRTDLTITPTAGNTVVTACLEVDEKNKAAVLAKLAEAKELCKNYQARTWPASAQTGCDPSVAVRVIVRDDVSSE